MKKAIALVLALILAIGAVSAFAEELPAFEPKASDTVNYPVEKLLSDVDRAKQNYRFEEGCVVIPVAVVYKVAGVPDPNADIFKVYGSFYTDVYKLNGEVLEFISGGTDQGVITVEKKADGNWTVIAEEYARDGTYTDDLKRIAGSDAELLGQYLETENNEAHYETARRENITRYVESNDLSITGYKDYGSDAVSLTD